ncbi:MAG: glucosyltransferase domain-containing protein [Clostridia bacterium]|nr:glucosyltransferase domain-containing protein [Clostridia bacterium]
MPCDGEGRKLNPQTTRDERARRTLTRAQLGEAALWVAVFTALAHLYRYLTMGFSHDSMMIVESGNVEGQIGLGRFMQPLYWLVRGYITSPLTIGLFATAFLIAAAWIILELTGVRSRPGIALVCGVLATNETYACSCASYLPWMDVYMLAMLLALLGVLLEDRLRRGYWISPVLYCLSMGLYQSYMQTAAALVILMLIARTLDGERTGDVFAAGVQFCLTALAGMLLYRLVYPLVIQWTGATVSQEYNSVSGAMEISLAQLPALLGGAYMGPLRHLFDPAETAFVPAPVNWLLLAALAVTLGRRARGLGRARQAMLLFLLAMLPLGMNFVPVISKGIVHMLMNYAYFFFYVLCLMAYERREKTARRGERVLRGATALLISLALTVNIATANRMYMKRDLELSSTLSVMTRVLGEAERTEGYVPGETPVVFFGYLPSSKVSMVRPGFEEISAYQGMRSTYAPYYVYANMWYFSMALGYPLNYLDADEIEGADEIMQRLSQFPEKGYMQMIDGVLFIRLS